MKRPGTNAENIPRSIRQSNVPEESRRNGPSLAQIRERAFEIHIERGGIHAATWTTGCRRNASSRKSTTRATMGGEKEMTCIPTQSSLRSQRPQLSTRLEENRMLKITFRETPEEERWALHGLLTDPRVQQFRACWKKSHRTDVRRDCIVDLNEVTFIDKCGERLLRLLAKEGTKFTASGMYTKHILEHLDLRQKSRIGICSVF